MRKDSKLGIITNVSKSRLVKVIFSNIHKISDACANSFGRYIIRGPWSWLHNVLEMFLLFIKFKFLWKSGVSEKIKRKWFTPAPLKHYNNCSVPHLFNFIQKTFGSTPIQKRGQRLCILHERLQRRDNKVITILYGFISILLFYLQNCKVITFEEN